MHTDVDVAEQDGAHRKAAQQQYQQLGAYVLDAGLHLLQHGGLRGAEAAANAVASTPAGF
jgi:hypothetical protein